MLRSFEKRSRVAHTSRTGRLRSLAASAARGNRTAPGMSTIAFKTVKSRLATSHSTLRRNSPSIQKTYPGPLIREEGPTLFSESSEASRLILSIDRKCIIPDVAIRVSEASPSGPPPSKFSSSDGPLTWIFRDASIGITKRATPSDASRENTTVSAISPKICPATPSTKTIGKNTATVVRVDANTAPPTSPVPRTVALTRSSPSSRHR